MIIRPHTTSRPRQKLKRLALAALVFWTTQTVAADTRWFLVPEPHFMEPDFQLPIAGTKDTVLTPMLVKGENAVYLTKENFTRLGLDMDSIRRVSRESASKTLAELKPRIARDKNGVAVFAILQSDQPVVAATVWAPDFVDRFQELFGPELLVAIPNRYRVYVYPALASRFQATADYVLSDYSVSAYPVSREVFRVTRNGVEAVGTFEER